MASLGARLSRDRALGWAASISGPALIVAGPAIALRAYWFTGLLTNVHVDILAFWLPRWCFLGSAVSSGHVPTWLPNQFGGVPFVSDPQSGWLYAPVMALFSSLPCSRAMAVMIALNPIVAGLGLYLFFRREGTGRPAATIGGLTLGLSMASSVVALSMPFAGTLAWTAVAVAGAAGYLHARTRSTALAWMGLLAFGLSQVAAAQMTDGLLIAALVLVPYVAFRSIRMVRDGERRPRAAAAMAVAPIAAFPILGAALLLPRLSLIPRTSIGHGYLELTRLSEALSGTPSTPLAARGTPGWWGMSFARGPSGYVGVLAVVLLAVAFASKRWRLPAIGFALAGLAGWLLNLDWMVRTGAVRSFALRYGVGELWLRSPGRFRYLLILAFAGIAGYGVQAWLDAAPARSRRDLAVRGAWLALPVFVFVIWPLAAGGPFGPYVPIFLGLAAAVPLLAWAARGARWAPVALALLVAVELTTAAVTAQFHRGAGVLRTGSGGNGVPGGHAFAAMPPPHLRPVVYLEPGPIGTMLQQSRGDFGRYLSYDPLVAAAAPVGFLTHQRRAFWPAFENGRSILFGIDEIQGYSPIQLDRYWRLVRRAATGYPIAYNAATFQSVRPEILNLFGVEWIIVRTKQPAPPGTTPVATEGMYTLYRVLDHEPRASVVFDWSRVPVGRGLDVVLSPGFDPARRAIVEGQTTVQGRPVTPPGSGTGSAQYSVVTPEHVVVHVSASAPGLLVVRNGYDRNWHAMVDGTPAPLLPADYLMQGVVVPAGTHTVELLYRDRAVGLGALVSAVAWALLAGAIAWPWFRRRAGRRRAHMIETAPPPGDRLIASQSE